jgi:hypothetical protein
MAKMMKMMRMRITTHNQTGMIHPSLGGGADSRAVVGVAGALPGLAGTVAAVGGRLCVGVGCGHADGENSGGEEEGGQDTLHDLPLDVEKPTALGGLVRDILRHAQDWLMIERMSSNCVDREWPDLVVGAAAAVVG